MWLSETRVLPPAPLTRQQTQSASDLFLPRLPNRPDDDYGQVWIQLGKFWALAFVGLYIAGSLMPAKYKNYKKYPWD